MTCKNPYIKGPLAFGCGSCTPCKVKYAREWRARILLEQTQHESSVFITLSYDGDSLPDDYSLRPDHTRDFLKRLRKAVSPLKFRYFLCGEYGTKNMRPHYHAILFGYPTCLKGQSFFTNGSCCPPCDLLRDKWGHGLILSGTVTPQSAGYVSGYITKVDHRDLGTLYPPFTRVSRKPGLGYNALHDVASTLLEYDLEKTLADVPLALDGVGPLGKYLRKNLRLMIGRDEKIPPAILDQLIEDLRPLREASQNSGLGTIPGFKEFAFKQAVIDRDEGKIIHAQHSRSKSKRKRTL